MLVKTSEPEPEKIFWKTCNLSSGTSSIVVMVVTSKLARLERVGLKLRVLFCMVLYVVCNACISRWETVVQCGVVYCGRLYVDRQRFNGSRNQTGLEFGCRVLCDRTARGYQRSPWTSGAIVAQRQTVCPVHETIVCGTCGFRPHFCGIRTVCEICQFTAPTFDSCGHCNYRFRAFYGIGNQTCGFPYSCSCGRSCGRANHRKIGRQIIGETCGEKIVKTVSLASIERIADRYATDDSIGGTFDTLRIACTLGYRLKRRKRRITR